MAGLYWNTVNGLLKNVLEKIMASSVFEEFRLVGGTSLSLQFGHRISTDIDLFTDALYGSVNFDSIYDFLRDNYPYVSTNPGQVGIGTSYFVGESEQNAVKIDLYYTDQFIRPIFKVDNIRLASPEDIIAMKLEVISQGGRKKDFWDIHEMTDQFDIASMIGFHKERHPYAHDEELIRAKLVDFSAAEDEFEPQCLKGKYWQFIKLDLIQWLA